MPVLENLPPRAVFRHFEALSAIPRGSGHTKAVSDWCVSFAGARGLECHRDAAGNVIIIAPASPGYESAPPLILQGHLDMVCAKEPGNPLDMERQGPELEVEGGFVRAKGTTLGADDGIAVAMALAVLDDPSLPRPRLEVVLTTDEEIGMLGAAALDVSPLRGRQLLNLDSEVEGVFTVGCAGGCCVSCTLPLGWEQTEEAAVRLSLSGLTGGHSGTEIRHGRANANQLMGRILRSLSAGTELRLVRVGGGEKENAIPVSAEAEFVTKDPALVGRLAARMEKALRQEYRATDPELSVSVSEALAVFAMDGAATERVLKFLTLAPNGVRTMSRELPGLVQTSLNLGVVRTEPQGVTASFCVRSGVSQEKEELAAELGRLAEQLGGSVTVEGDYPAWEYQADSPLRRRCQEVFRDLYRQEPKVETIHAGLECGVLSARLPGLDCVSLGPDIPDIHTPRERLSIVSVRRVWAFLLEVLKRSR